MSTTIDRITRSTALKTFNREILPVAVRLDWDVQATREAYLNAPAHKRRAAREAAREYLERFGYTSGDLASAEPLLNSGPKYLRHQVPFSEAGIYDVGRSGTTLVLDKGDGREPAYDGLIAAKPEAQLWEDIDSDNN